MQLRDNLNANLNVGYCSAGRSWLSISKREKKLEKKAMPSQNPATSPRQGTNPGQREDGGYGWFWSRAGLGFVPWVIGTLGTKVA